MKNVKVLGSGCANCRNTIRLIEEVAAAKGAQIVLEKVEDLQQIMTYGIMAKRVQETFRVRRRATPLRSHGLSPFEF